jgi:hypothetical protein
MGSEKEPQQQDGGRSAEGPDGTNNRAHDLASETASTPAWADGLKELYRSVVDEPLPGNFKNLLDQFDETAEDEPRSEPGNSL